jgi:hypothetical protein
MKYAFTSLHIPEESKNDKDAIKLIKCCKDEGLCLMVDVSPHTLEKYNIKSYEELKSLGVEYLRPDFDNSVNICAPNQIIPKTCAPNQINS